MGLGLGCTCSLKQKEDINGERNMVTAWPVFINNNHKISEQLPSELLRMTAWEGEGDCIK